MMMRTPSLGRGPTRMKHNRPLCRLKAGHVEFLECPGRHRGNVRTRLHRLGSNSHGLAEGSVWGIEPVLQGEEAPGKRLERVAVPRAPSFGGAAIDDIGRDRLNPCRKALSVLFEISVHAVFRCVAGCPRQPSGQWRPAEGLSRGGAQIHGPVKHGRKTPPDAPRLNYRLIHSPKIAYESTCTVRGYTPTGPDKPAPRGFAEGVPALIG